MTDEAQPKPAKTTGRPIHPIEAAQLLLASIEEADETTRNEWSRAVVREMDINEIDFLLGLRRIARGN